MISKPTLLVNETQVRENIRMMNNKAIESQVTFRPHFKTHFSAEIGEYYREIGIRKITVSSIDMAVYFANHGWNDITIAFPVNVLEIKTLNLLASKIRLNLVVESISTVLFLYQNMKSDVNILLKIDTGYGRAGINWENYSLANDIISFIDAPLHFEGLLAHFGHSYQANDKAGIQGIYEVGVSRLNSLKQQLDLEHCPISIGDTPSCSTINSFGAVDEIRPGNFVFYDLMQAQNNICELEQIAVCMVCPVVAIYPDKNKIIIHGGAVHFSKECIINENRVPYYGSVVSANESSWNTDIRKDVYLKSLSQEHGIIFAPDDYINQIAVGDILGVLPVHSCLTANLMRDYLTLDGKIIKTMNSVC